MFFCYNQIMKIEIPERDSLDIQNIILDLNGTIAIDGILIEGIKERIEQIKLQGIRVYLFSGDTHGNALSIAQELEIELVKTINAEEKLKAAKTLGLETTATIGNGLIDALIVKETALGIIVIQKEGAHPATLMNADIVIPTIHDALELFINPKRIVATIRP